MTFEEYLTNHEDESTFETVEEYENDPLRNMSIDDLKELIRDVTIKTIEDKKRANK
ncbi:MAG: hypothetical protein RBQ80_08305 [Methanocorpusculum sp.]|nr:hypothetical protein [Methanocorpusculum sp.]